MASDNSATSIQRCKQIMCITPFKENILIQYAVCILSKCIHITSFCIYVSKNRRKRKCVLLSDVKDWGWI